MRPSFHVDFKANKFATSALYSVFKQKYYRELDIILSLSIRMFSS